MRVETFVFEFADQEVFEKFFESYFQNPPPGIEPLSCQIGDALKKLDDAEELLGECLDTDTLKLPLETKILNLLGE